MIRWENWALATSDMDAWSVVAALLRQLKHEKKSKNNTTSALLSKFAHKSNLPHIWAPVEFDSLHLFHSISHNIVD